MKYKPTSELSEFQRLARDMGYDLGIIFEDGKMKIDGLSSLDENFLKILLEKGKNGEIADKIKKLEEENIFLPKYLQTVVDIPDHVQVQIEAQLKNLAAIFLVTIPEKYF